MWLLSYDSTNRLFLISLKLTLATGYAYVWTCTIEQSRVHVHTQMNCWTIVICKRENWIDVHVYFYVSLYIMVHSIERALDSLFKASELTNFPTVSKLTYHQQCS